MGVNDAQEMLEAAQDECIRLERENAELVAALAERSTAFDDAVAVNSREVERRTKAQAERDAALAVIERVKSWNTHDTEDPTFWDLHHILAQSPPSALAKVEADALRGFAKRVDANPLLVGLMGSPQAAKAARDEADRIEKEATGG